MNKAKHAFGQSSGIEAAKQAGKIDAFDILFLDGDTEPKIGWLDSQGDTVLIDHRADLAKVESKLESQISTKANVSDVEALQTELATKIGAEEVDAKIATKADASEIEALQTEVANKVDAAAVQTMIEEHAEAAIEVVEF